MMGTLDVAKIFTRGKSQIPNTVFFGGQRSQYCSSRNKPMRGMQTPMTVLPFSLGKGVATLNELVAKVEKTTGKYYVRLKRPGGHLMTVEYDNRNNRFTHSCSAKGGICYHLFIVIAAIELAENPNGEFSIHYRNIDWSKKPVDDEENFFKACDALYFDIKERYNKATLIDKIPQEADDLEDITPLVLPSAKSANAPSKSPVSSHVPVKMVWQTLSDEEIAIMEKAKKDLEGKKLPDKFRKLAQQMASGKVISALFIGGAGSAKTTTARLIGREIEAPVRVQNYSLNSEELDIIGGFVPVPGGGFEWRDGELTKSFRNGGIYVADEINFAKPAVLGVLNNMLDGVGQIVLRNGEVVDRHPNFRFIACMNVGYAGTQRMNVALINRFNRVFKFEVFDRQKQIEIITNETGYRNIPVIEKMIEVFEAIRKKIKEEQIDGAAVSIRNLINWANDVQETGDLIESALPTMVWAVSYEDEDVQKEILDDIIVPRLRGVKP